MAKSFRASTVLANFIGCLYHSLSSLILFFLFILCYDEVKLSEGKVKERKSKSSQEYAWEGLINNIRKLQRSSRRAPGSQVLVIKKKEFLEHNKIIERGLVRWECIRRNKKFRQFYKADQSILFLGRNVCLTPETTKEEMSKEISRIKVKIDKNGNRSFQSRDDEHKYSTYFIFLKDLGHDPSLNNSAVKPKNLSGLVYDCLTQKDISKFSAEEINNFIAQIPQEVEFIVDFGYTKQEILFQFKKQIDMWFRLHKAAKLNNAKRALHYSNIKRYLNVYDLKNDKSKTTFADLAARLYPGTASKNLDSTIQQVKREYKRACELISGGFVFIK
jgi:hypothetical protein